MKKLALTAWLLLLCACVPKTEPPTLKAEGLLAMSLPEMAAALHVGDVSSATLVAGYVNRIDAIDRAGPELRAVLSVNPLAMQEARNMDRLRGEGRLLGPLHGIPILLKDNIESKDPLATTAGSLALKDNVTGRDAPLVDGLRKAGAIILGKTNMSEWANFRSESSMSGWSGLGGQVKNPHMLDRNPCGSSSGSAAAVAASLVAGAVGTETNGSIICPATVNGIVGFKPTLGLISQQFIVPISPTQDTAGPMTKTVAGAAIMLDAMDDAEINYLSRLSVDALRGKRLGIVRFAVGDDRSLWPLFEAALLTLEAAGAELVDIEKSYPLPDNFRGLAFTVLLYEFKASLNDYLANLAPNLPHRNLADLIAFNRDTERELVLFDQSIFEQAVVTESLTAPTYTDAREKTYVATRNEGIDRYLAEYEVDFLIAPSGIPAPRVDPLNGDVWPPFVGIGWMAAIAGYPHVTVPMGTVSRLPVGLSVIGRAGDDAAVLAAAYAYEQASDLRADPDYLPAAEGLVHIESGLARWKSLPDM